MPNATVIVPGSIATLTGGYGYDRRIVAGLRDLGWRIEVRELAASFPEPTPDALSEAAAVFAALPDQTVVVIDGLAGGAMPDLLAAEQARLRLIALVHHPLAEETGVAPALRARLASSEARALGSVARIVVTSRATVAALKPYGISADRITVVEPGTDPAPLAAGSSSGPLALLCVASLTPRKGHDVLLGALARVRDRAWHLTCVGSADRDRATAAALAAQVRALDLEDRVTCVGEMSGSTLDDRYAGADLFVLATRLEGYGMVVAEALARGVPVVSTATGAIPELVGEDAGLLLPIDDVEAWARGLAAVLDDRALRARLKQGAARARGRLPTWADSAARFAALLTEAARG